MEEPAQDYQSLLRFLYRAPMALVQATVLGQIEMMSPVAAQLLLPLSRQGLLENVFEVLAEVAPDLRPLCDRFSPPSGSICEAVRLDVPGDGCGRPAQVLTVSIIKLSSSTLILMLTDITAQTLQSQQEAKDRQATKQRLAELSSDLEHALAVVAVSIVREDLVTGRMMSTERLCRSLGLDAPPEGVTVARWLQHVHPEDREMFNEDRERAASGLQTSFRDFRFLKSDGSVGYMAGRRYLEHDAQGRPVSLVTFGIDVTEQRTLERERLALAEHLSLATMAARVGTFEVAARTGKVVWNAQTYALYGRPDRVGQDTRQIAREALSDFQLTRVSAWKRGMLQGRAADAIEFELTWPDDTVHWLAARGRLRFDDWGQKVSLIGVMWEVTERRRSEEATRAQQVAEQASRAKTEFLSRMSHELRTPLNAVIGFSELLQMNGKEPLSPGQLMQVQHINAAGRHLLQLTSDLLDVSLIELGKLNIRCTQVWVDEVVRDAVHEIQPLACSRLVRVTVQAPSERAAVLADGTRLMQVLLNLLSNAVKYNRDSGEVTVRWTRTGDEWCIVVADTGIGMTPAQQQALFQAFNRLGRDESSVEGVGIGLVVTRQLTEAMDGTLTVSSLPEVGSEFNVRLPAVDPA